MGTTLLRAAVTSAIYAVGMQLKVHFGKAPSLRSKNGYAADVVTTFDIDAEKFLAERLRAYDPTIGFMGEEGGHTGSHKHYWLVDPIDGTGHFIRGIPFCTTMVALVEDGIVIFSAIYNFVTGEMFVAERGKGATLNEARIRVSERPLRASYLCIETDLENRYSIDAFVALNKLCPRINTVSCGYEFGLIAKGKLDGRICFDPYGKDWDYGPGSLLVEEAGGIVTNIGSTGYDLRNHDFIAANPLVHEELSRSDSPLAEYM